MRKRSSFVPVASLGWFILTASSSVASDLTYLRSRSNFFPLDRIEFDPSDCADDAVGMIYVSLGRSVFRWPADSPPAFKFLEGDDWYSDQPLAIEPSEPLGCPANPYPLGAIGLEVDPEPVTLHSLSPDGAAAFVEIIFAPGDISLQKRHEEAFASECGKSKWITPEGFVRCSYSIDETPLFETFKIGAEIASLPLGESLYLRCAAIPRVSTCRGDYRFDDSVYLGFEIARNAMSIREMVELARALGVEIAKAKIPDYRWDD